MNFEGIDVVLMFCSDKREGQRQTSKLFAISEELTFKVYSTANIEFREFGGMLIIDAGCSDINTG